MFNTWPIAITMNVAGYVADTACCVSPLLSAISAGSAERSLGHTTAGGRRSGNGLFTGAYANGDSTGSKDRGTPKAWSGQRQPQLEQRPESLGNLPVLQMLHSTAKPGGGDLAQ